MGQGAMRTRWDGRIVARCSVAVSLACRSREHNGTIRALLGPQQLQRHVDAASRGACFGVVNIRPLGAGCRCTHGTIWCDGRRNCPMAHGSSLMAPGSSPIAPMAHRSGPRSRAVMTEARGNGWEWAWADALAVHISCTSMLQAAMHPAIGRPTPSQLSLVTNTIVHAGMRAATRNSGQGSGPWISSCNGCPPRFYVAAATERQQ